MTTIVESIDSQGDRAEQSGLGSLGRVLVLWYLAVMFTVFSLQIGEVRIACFFALPAAVVMFARNGRQISHREVALLAVVLAVALISVVAGIDADFVGERAKSFLLICYSLFMAYALRLELGRAKRKDIAWVSGWLSVAIIIAAILEYLGPLKPISDTFRIWNSQFVYTHELRDLRIAGHIRPAVFTSEPSLVAIGMAVFTFSWFVTTQSKHRIALLGLVTALTVYLVRSPISAIIIPPVGLVVLIGALRQASGNRRAQRVYFASAMLMFVVPTGFVLFATILESRGGWSGDQSLAIRLIAPPRITVAVLEEAPLIGAGIGGRGAILNQMENTFFDLGLARAMDWSDNEIRLANLFWEHWIYFGLLGGSVAGYAIARYFRMLCGTDWIPVALFVFLLANAMGAYSTPRPWSFATLVLIATALSAPVASGKPQLVSRDRLEPYRQEG